METKDNLNEQLRQLKKDPDALEQSLGLNRILFALIDSLKRTQRWLCILVVVSILCNVLISAIFVIYESQFTTETVTTTTQTTVEQDTDGPGNNVYQSGENSQYVQGDVRTNGETTSNNHYNDDENDEEQVQPDGQ